MSRATEVLQEWFAGHRKDALAADVVFRDMSYPVREVYGPDAVERHVGGLYGAFEETGVKEGRVHEAGVGIVIIEFTFWGRGLKHGMGPAMVAGSDAEMPICAVYQIRRDKIREIRVYYNIHTLLAQLQDAVPRRPRARTAGRLLMRH